MNWSKGKKMDIRVFRSLYKPIPKRTVTGAWKVGKLLK